MQKYLLCGVCGGKGSVPVVFVSSVNICILKRTRRSAVAGEKEEIPAHLKDKNTPNRKPASAEVTRVLTFQPREQTAAPAPGAAPRSHKISTGGGGTLPLPSVSLPLHSSHITAVFVADLKSDGSSRKPEKRLVVFKRGPALPHAAPLISHRCG